MSQYGSTAHTFPQWAKSRYRMRLHLYLTSLSLLLLSFQLCCSQPPSLSPYQDGGGNGTGRRDYGPPVPQKNKTQRLPFVKTVTGRRGPPGRRGRPAGPLSWSGVREPETDPPPHPSRHSVTEILQNVLLSHLFCSDHVLTATCTLQRRSSQRIIIQQFSFHDRKCKFGAENRDIRWRTSENIFWRMIVLLGLWRVFWCLLVMMFQQRSL